MKLIRIPESKITKALKGVKRTGETSLQCFPVQQRVSPEEILIIEQCLFTAAKFIEYAQLQHAIEHIQILPEISFIDPAYADIVSGIHSKR